MRIKHHWWLTPDSQLNATSYKRIDTSSAATRSTFDQRSPPKKGGSRGSQHSPPEKKQIGSSRKGRCPKAEATVMSTEVQGSFKFYWLILGKSATSAELVCSTTTAGSLNIFKPLRTAHKRSIITSISATVAKHYLASTILNQPHLTTLPSMCSWPLVGCLTLVVVIPLVRNDH